MEQESLFFESVEDVLDAVIRATGGHKQVANDLWPSLRMETAYARIKACLNPEKAEKFSPSELMWLLARGRAKGLHIAMHWLCGELGYAPPSPVEPADQEADINRQLDASLEKLEHLTSRLARIRGIATQ